MNTRLTTKQTAALATLAQCGQPWMAMPVNSTMWSLVHRGPVRDYANPWSHNGTYAITEAGLRVFWESQ